MEPMNETPDHAPPRPVMKQYYTELDAATIINAMSAHPCSLHIGVFGVGWELPRSMQDQPKYASYSGARFPEHSWKRFSRFSNSVGLCG